jgi:hypothetical protein
MTNTHIAHAENQFVVCGGSDQYWRGVTAKTLTGAKIAASKFYGQESGGKIDVAQVRGEQYVRVAVKHGFDKWQSE